MGLKIIKPVMTSEAKITIFPTITRFFYEMEKSVSELTTFKIDAAKFLDDAGNTVQSLPPLSMNNSYFNVYINGFLQMDDNFAYTSGEEGIGNLLISVPDDAEINTGTPIIVEVVNYDPTVKN